MCVLYMLPILTTDKLVKKVENLEKNAKVYKGIYIVYMYVRKLRKKRQVLNLTTCSMICHCLLETSTFTIVDMSM